MKKHFLFLLTTIISINCYSQISFEKGYYIDNTDEKTECLIKNMDWKNNPTEFEYKLSENSDPKTTTIKSVKEFGIYNISKYIRSTTNIDRSSKNIKYLTTNKYPVFQKEELFLKVLVDGQAILYSYVDGDLRRYFYSKDNSNIEQLIHKSYFVTGKNIGTNNRFKQQLLTDLKCENFKKNRVKNVNYTKGDLVRLFVDYSECNNNNTVNFEKKQKRESFNLNIRPRLNSSTVSIKNLASNSRNFEFENTTGFAFGIEAEYILPFNKNKWALAIEPTFQSYTSNETIKTDNVSGGTLRAEIDYSSIEAPISLRHYMFLNNDSKLFINASFIVDFSSKSLIEFKRANNSTLQSTKINSGHNFGLGIGYKLYDKYSVEIRYLTSRELTGSDDLWDIDYKTISLIVGYSLF